MATRSVIQWIFRVYKLFTLSEDYPWETGINFGKNYEFRDKKKENKLRMTISENGTITVMKGYSWDGCTPKFSVFDFFVMGTPDGILSDKTGKPKAYHASLVHDALYQFLPELPPDNKIYTRKMADDIFWDILEDAKFAPRNFYWLGVRLFGGLFMNSRKYISRQTEGMVQEVKGTSQLKKKKKAKPQSRKAE